MVGNGTGEFVQTIEKQNGKTHKRHYRTKYVEYHIGRGSFYSPEVLMRNYLDEKLRTAMDSTKQPGQVREWKGRRWRIGGVHTGLWCARCRAISNP